MEDVIAQFNATLERMASDEEFAHEVLVQGRGNPITLGPRVKSATEWVEDMVSGAKARSKNWLKNSLAPKKDPKAAAKAAVGKYENNMRASLDEKRYDAGIDAIDEVAREAVIKAVGEEGFRRGVETHRAKAEAKIKKLQPLVAAVAKTIDAMPQDTESQREERMLAARRLMIEVGKKMRVA